MAQVSGTRRPPFLGMAHTSWVSQKSRFRLGLVVMCCKALTAAIGALVLTLVAFGIAQTMWNSDLSGKPTKEQLLVEMSRLRPMSGKSAIRYINKLSAVYVIGQGTTGGRQLFDVDPVAAGWSFESRRRYDGGEVVRYCRGRLTLSVDTNAKATTADFGIYWSSDRSSSFYCS